MRVKLSYKNKKLKKSLKARKFLEHYEAILNYDLKKILVMSNEFAQFACNTMNTPNIKWFKLKVKKKRCVERRKK